MNTIATICGILIIILAAFQFSHINKRKKASNELINMVVTKQFDALYTAESDSKFTKYIPKFNRKLLCMNAALIQNSNIKVQSYFDQLASMNLSSVQKKVVYMSGLQYFVAIQDYTRCQTCYNALINLNMDDDTKQYLEEINSVMILKKSDKLSDILTRIGTMSTSEVFADEFLVTEIYKNLGDTIKAKEYSDLANMHLDIYINETRK